MVFFTFFLFHKYNKMNYVYTEAYLKPKSNIYNGVFSRKASRTVSRYIFSQKRSITDV